MHQIKQIILQRLLPKKVSGWLRIWRLERTLQHFTARIVEHRYGNTRLKVYISDSLADGWYDHDWDDLPEIAELRPWLTSDSTVFDFGAHQGVVAMMLCNEVGPSGRVIAIEPNAHNVAAMIRNRELNDCRQLQIMHAAVAAKNGDITFNEALNGQIDDGTGAWGATIIEGITVDSVAERFGMPSVVFIDVEGAECLALAGASRVLASDASFFVEVHVGVGLEKLGGSVAEVLSYFPENRYKILGRAEGESGFHPFDTDDHLTATRFLLLALSRGAVAAPL